MKIVLVVTNSRRKSLAFVSNDLDVYNLEKAVQLTREGKIEGAHVVQRGKEAYIRTNPKVAKSDEFDTLSVTIGNLLLYAHGFHITKVSPRLNTFIELYSAQLRKNEQLIKPVDQPEVISESVREKLQRNRNIVFDAAKKFNIDPYLIGAILIDEIARLVPFESIAETLGVLIAGQNISIGIAQVRIDTANDLINKGFYNPNPDDKKLPLKKLDSSSRAHLYSYLIQPKHNIFFAGAKIRSLIDEWKRYIDLAKRPEIIATLYHQSHKVPHAHPASNQRGLQIAEEFYPFAKKWL